MFEHALLVAAAPPLDELPILESTNLHATNREFFPASGVAHEGTLVGAGECVGKCNVGVVCDESLDFDVQIREGDKHFTVKRSIACGAWALPGSRVIIYGIFGHEVVEQFEFSAVHGMTEFLLCGDIRFLSHRFIFFPGFNMEGRGVCYGDRCQVGFSHEDLLGSHGRPEFDRRQPGNQTMGQVRSEPFPASR